MKKSLIAFITLSLLGPSAFAETRICTSADGSVVADISENYIGGTILIRRLHKIEANGQIIYRNWLGKLDDGGEVLQLDQDLFVKMFSGGINVETSKGTVTLECGPGF